MDAAPTSAQFRRRLCIFLAVAACGLAIDLATKSWAFNWLGMPQGPTHWVVKDVLGVQTSLNYGALFGMGQGQTWLFVALSGVAMVGIASWIALGEGLYSWLTTISLGCITGGVLGNLHDRLGLSSLRIEGEPVHAVRDWILVMIGNYHWPNFNVADSLLVCGALVMSVKILRTPANSGLPAATKEQTS